MSTLVPPIVEKERDLWSVGVGRWKLLASFTILGILIGVVLAAVLPRQYRVQTTLLIVKTENPTSSQTGVARSLASIVGVGIGQDDIREEALALLRSDRLAWEFLTKHEVVPLLLEDLGEVEEEDIRGTVIDVFKEDVLSVQDDRRTGLITVSVLWRDRQQAAEWANSYVRLADEVLRAQALADSERTLDLLEQELERTILVELRNSINRLYETQLQRMLWARARSEFALRTIDPALAPATSDTAAPNKRLIIASAFVLGVLAGLIAAVVLETSAVLRKRGMAEMVSAAV